MTPTDGGRHMLTYDAGPYSDPSSPSRWIGAAVEIPTHLSAQQNTASFLCVASSRGKASTPDQSKRKPCLSLRFRALPLRNTTILEHVCVLPSRHTQHVMHQAASLSALRRPTHGVKHTVFFLKLHFLFVKIQFHRTHRKSTWFIPPPFPCR